MPPAAPPRVVVTQTRATMALVPFMTIRVEPGLKPYLWRKGGRTIGWHQTGGHCCSKGCLLT